MEIVGAVFPIPSQLVDRIFRHGKDVFVKPPTVFRDLKPGSKILFYASGDIRAIVGEATARDIELLDPEEAIKKYSGRIFLSPAELRSYLKSKKRASKILVIPLKDIKLYKKPYKPKRFITVAGKRLTKAEYEQIIKAVQ